MNSQIDECMICKNESDAEKVRVQCTRINAHIHAALQRLACHGPKSMEGQGNQKPDTFRLSVLLDDMTPEGLAAAALNTDIFVSIKEDDDSPCCKFSGFAIQIDDSCDQQEPNLDLELVIIMYNYGIACKCNSSTVNTKTNATNILNCADKCFRLSATFYGFSPRMAESR
jgi:hypothetical protein